MKIRTLLDWKLWLLLSLTLGLMPFRPEPHIVAKVRWIVGGAKGMQVIDWWDTMMHGFPFLMLIISVGYRINENRKRSTQKADREY